MSRTAYIDFLFNEHFNGARPVSMWWLGFIILVTSRRVHSDRPELDDGLIPTTWFEGHDQGMIVNNLNINSRSNTGWKISANRRRP